jgi:phosphomannomutase
MAMATGSARSTAQGRVIWGDQLLMIYAEDLLRILPGSAIIADVKASRALFDRVVQLGGRPTYVENRTQPD